MSNAKKHKDQDGFDELTNNLFDEAKIPFELSKEDAWKQMETRLNLNEQPLKTRSINYKWIFGIAATIILLVGIFSVLRFYTTTVISPPGQHLTANLPDGSTVHLNAGSTLSYKPFWWNYSRTVKFEGEAFFEVQKGEKFSVVSGIARTEVLGTSFNIYSRNNQYKVSCQSGKVKVISKNKDEGILSPGYEAKLSLDGKVVIYKSKDAKSSISWMDNKFIFTAVPLHRVFEEIERQYDVKIKIPDGITYSYTGYFTKDRSVDEVIGLVCKPFGLNFVAKSGNTFEVFRNE